LLKLDASRQTDSKKVVKFDFKEHGMGKTPVSMLWDWDVKLETKPETEKEYD